MADSSDVLPAPTHNTLQVLMALMDDPFGRHWGYDLSKRTGLRSGALYPVLHRLLEEGWLQDGWEDASDAHGKRPPRRYYELTPDGREAIAGRAGRGSPRRTL